MKFTPGPWTNRGRYNAMQDEIGVKDRALAVVWTRQAPQVRDEKTGAVPWEEGEANARLIVAAPELLSELQKAHQIIQNALQLMTPEQKSEWARTNSRDGCIGDGTTRYHERKEAIAKATGGSTS